MSDGRWAFPAGGLFGSGPLDARIDPESASARVPLFRKRLDAAIEAQRLRSIDAGDPPYREDTLAHYIRMVRAQMEFAEAQVRVLRRDLPEADPAAPAFGEATRDRPRSEQAEDREGSDA